MDNLWGETYEWSEFPAWRKVLLFGCVALFFIIGYQLFSKETDIYTTAPSAPEVETIQLVPVRVNHGTRRYVAEKEAEQLKYLRDTVPSVVIVLLLGAVTILLTYRGAH